MEDQYYYKHSTLSPISKGIRIKLNGIIVYAENREDYSIIFGEVLKSKRLSPYVTRHTIKTLSEENKQQIRETNLERKVLKMPLNFW